MPRPRPRAHWHAPRSHGGSSEPAPRWFSWLVTACVMAGWILLVVYLTH